MKSLMASDLFKLKKGKYLYGCTIGSVLLRIFIIIIMYSVLQMDDSSSASGYEILSKAIGSGSALLVSIAISIFVGAEFGFGTIKNSATKAFSRTRIYMSKLLVSFIATICILLITAVVYVLLGTIVFGWGTPPDGYILDAIAKMGVQIYLNLALSSMFVMVAILIRQSAGSIAINICILQFAGLVAQICSLAFDKLFHLTIEFSKYLPSTIISDTVDVEKLTSELTIRGLVAGAVIIVLTTAFGIFSLQKRDIK